MPGVWVSFTIDDEHFWVRIPRTRIERRESLRWIGWGAFVLALALRRRLAHRVPRQSPAARADARRGSDGPRQDAAARSRRPGPSEISTLSRAFNQMAADLKRLDDERALLLAGVSHDLRTPLSRIRLGLEMLDDKGDAALKAGMVQDIEDIDAAISQFLDFARIERGRGGQSRTAT